MTFVEKLKTILFHPVRAFHLAGWKWAYFLMTRQALKLSAKPEVKDFSKTHYAWREVGSGFEYAIFCLQETNLQRFVKSNLPYEKIGTAIELGSVSDLFLKEIPAQRKVGINVIPACIEQLNSQGIEGRLSRGTEIPARAGEADLIICFQTLEHVPDPIDFLREMARIMAENACMLLSIPWVETTNIRPRFHGQEAAARPESEYHIFEFSHRDFEKVVSHTPLEIERMEILHNYRYHYDPLSNYLIKKNFALGTFPAVMAYVLKRKADAP